MSTKPTSDRTRAKGRQPSPEFWILSRRAGAGFSPIMQNEPNSSLANSQSPKAKSCFYKTNPIAPRHQPTTLPEGQSKFIPTHRERAGEPNFHTNRPAQDQKTQNKPNLRPAKNTIRTQSTPAISLPRWPKASPGAPGNPIYRRDRNYLVRARSRRAGMPLLRKTNPI